MAICTLSLNNIHDDPLSFVPRNQAVAHEELAAGAGGDFRLVGDEDDRLMVFVEGFENRHDFLCRLRVEVPRRFVGHDDARLVDQCPGNGYALALAAGQLVGLVVGPRSQSYGFELFMARWVRSFVADAGVETKGRATFSSAVMRDRRLKFWKTKPMRWFRVTASSSSLRWATSLPLSLYDPSVGLSRQPRIFMSVDFPERTGP